MTAPGPWADAAQHRTGDPLIAPPPAVPLVPSAAGRKPTDTERKTGREQPLPPHVAMARYRKRVALLEAYPGQLVLRTSAAQAAVHPAANASRGHLIAGRIVLTAPDGTRHKLRLYEPGARVPSELGDDDRLDLGSSGIDIGDDPISTIIGLVLLVVYVVALPVAIVRWLIRRHRRTAVAKRLLEAARPATPRPAPG